MPEPSDSTVQAAVAAWLRSAESDLSVATGAMPTMRGG